MFAMLDFEIAMAESNLQDDESKRKEAGRDGFLTQPTFLRTLARVLESWRGRIPLSGPQATGLRPGCDSAQKEGWPPRAASWHMIEVCEE
jgi:hypothetical protein